MQTKKQTGSPEWVDPDDAPVLSREEIARADVYEGERLVRRGRPPIGNRPKEAIKLRLSADVLDHFRETGPGWQTRINDILERAARRAMLKAKSPEPSRHAK